MKIIQKTQSGDTITHKTPEGCQEGRKEGRQDWLQELRLAYATSN
ncbi:MAG: hypothetical protein RLN89_05685 [Parvibaculum sp.]